MPRAGSRPTTTHSGRTRIPALAGKAATLAPRAPAPVHVLTSGRLHPATSRAPLLPFPLPHGACPLLAHLLTQQAWGQFTDDQKHEMCFKVPQCHPVERKGAQSNVNSSGPKRDWNQAAPPAPPAPAP